MARISMIKAIQDSLSLTFECWRKFVPIIILTGVFFLAFFYSVGGLQGYLGNIHQALRQPETDKLPIVFQPAVVFIWFVASYILVWWLGVCWSYALSLARKCHFDFARELKVKFIYPVKLFLSSIVLTLLGLVIFTIINIALYLINQLLLFSHSSTVIGVFAVIWAVINALIYIMILFSILFLKIGIADGVSMLKMPFIGMRLFLKQPVSLFIAFFCLSLLALLIVGGSSFLAMLIFASLTLQAVFVFIVMCILNLYFMPFSFIFPAIVYDRLIKKENKDEI